MWDFNQFLGLAGLLLLGWGVFCFLRALAGAYRRSAKVRGAVQGAALVALLRK